ncbi:MAG: hypothetical protein RJB38_1668 [Pseudomonadota bacterium]|jgi:predicted nucleotidyltransferase
MSLSPRLSLRQREQILEAVRKIVPPDFLQEIWLFGSRAQPNEKGGDIDLWIECTAESLIDPLWSRKLRLELELSLGEQKIDLIFSGPEPEILDRQKKAFLRTIRQKRVSLWKKSLTS